jgi:hypothetical protein
VFFFGCSDERSSKKKTVRALLILLPNVQVSDTTKAEERFKD